MKTNNFPRMALLVAVFALSSCGGGSSGGNPDPDPGSDTTAPSGYSVAFVTDPIDESNETSVSFRVSGAEVGTRFAYTLSSGGSSVSDSGNVSQSNFDVTGVDLSGFPAGTVQLELRLTDSANNQGNAATDTAQKTNTPVVVTLSGTVTYDLIPHEPLPSGGGSFGLDYDNIQALPVRGATVQILDSSDAVLLTTETDGLGQYSVQLNPNQIVRVRVRAELLGDGQASWDFKVTDNTSGNAIYVLDGSLVTIGSADQTRDLHAPADWNFPGYSPGRRAAPFAILDTIYLILEKFLAIDPDIQFPATEFRWSENNVPESGDLEAGQISTSSYRSNGITGNVYVMGAEDEDTDEYDRHVIVHEWGHYFEDRLSRADSIGGSHSIFDSLDFRVAFGEGWGNALSAMILDDPLYKDTIGTNQTETFGVNVELNEDPRTPGSLPAIPLGWHSEFSVQSILYDLYDGDNDATGGDVVSLGLQPIYESLVADDYIEQRTLTTIYSFLAQLEADNPANAAAIQALATAQDIFGMGPTGELETNDGGFADSLSVYKQVSVDGSAVEVCTDNPFGEYNRLGNRQFVIVDLPSAGNYVVTASRTSGISDADPEIRITGPFPGSGEIAAFFCGDSTSGDSETMDFGICGGLEAGEHIIEVFDAGNVDDLDENDTTGGSVCFDVSVSS